MAITKKSLSNESSIAAYCLIMVLYCFNNLGLNLTFWIYFGLMLLFTTIYWYRIYSSDEQNKTYTFFQFDNLSIALFLLTIYFDVKYKFINFDLQSLSTYFLFMGLILILTQIFRHIFKSKKQPKG
jgi:hypothetical protein